MNRYMFKKTGYAWIIINDEANPLLNTKGQLSIYMTEEEAQKQVKLKQEAVKKRGRHRKIVKVVYFYEI